MRDYAVTIVCHKTGDKKAEFNMTVADWQTDQQAARTALCTDHGRPYKGDGYVVNVRFLGCWEVRRAA